MEKYFEIHAPGLFDEIYTSVLNESKEIPAAEQKELQQIRTVALMHSLIFYRNRYLILVLLQHNQKGNIPIILSEFRLYN